MYGRTYGQSCDNQNFWEGWVTKFSKLWDSACAPLARRSSANIHWKFVLKVVLKSWCHNRKTPVPACLPNGLHLLTTVLFQEAASGTAGFPTVYPLRLNTQRGTKSAFLIPKRYDEHPCHLNKGVPITKNKVKHFLANSFQKIVFILFQKNCHLLNRCLNFYCFAVKR